MGTQIYIKSWSVRTMQQASIQEIATTCFIQKKCSNREKIRYGIDSLNLKFESYHVTIVELLHKELQIWWRGETETQGLGPECFCRIKV